MENEPLSVDEGRSSRRGRLMGKLFGKDKKLAENNNATLDAFLHSAGGDKLDVTQAPPPPPVSLPKLDTTISRYPQALAVNQQAQQNRPMVTARIDTSRSPRISPRPNRKGMTVRFADSYPEIIGEGGDESEIPTCEIRRNRMTRSPQPQPQRSPGLNTRKPSASPVPPAGPPLGSEPNDDFQPKALKRTPTGYSSIYTPDEDKDTSLRPPRGTRDDDTLVPGRGGSARYLESSESRDEKRRSFIEVHQAQMREAEGKAFALAARTANAASQQAWDDGVRQPPPRKQDSPEYSYRQPPPYQQPPAYHQAPATPEPQSSQPVLDYSPAGSIASDLSGPYPTPDPPAPQLPIRKAVPEQNGSTASQPSMASRSMSVRANDGLGSAGDDALNAFVMGTKHLFELFRLHAEAIRPLSTCGPKECARAGVWWFLRGRMGLELAIRERPSTPKSQMQNQVDRQQAYSNLAKGYWLCQEVLPEVTRAQRLSPDAEVASAAQSVVSALRKLSQSMKRNGFLPPEESFLPQTIDKSIWLEYPHLSQDMVALLSGHGASGLTTMQHSSSTLSILDAFPLGDSTETFSYGRVMVDAFLMEQGRENQRLFLPCILSMLRPQNSTGLIFVLASQNGDVQLAVQDNKNVGPVWEDIRWQNSSCSVEIRLPRGFLLVAQLNQNDYKMLWNMYDFGAKVQAMLRPRSDEVVVFRSNLRSFKYLDGDSQSRVFPKETVPQCDVVLLEKIYKESGPSGPRTWHCGFRIAVVTGPRTRTLSGIQHTFPPPMPVEFGFFRTENDAPGLSVKYVNGRQEARMVFAFGDEKERIRFHSLLTGTAMNHGEKVFSEAPLKSFMISQSIREPMGIAPFSRMPWKAARVINDEFSSDGGDVPPTVLADRLRVVMEYQNGTVVDRVNVAPGELRMRLEVSNAKILRVLRQPQRDITMAVSEAQVPKELPKNMSDALQLFKGNQTIRTYEFNNLNDLHSFQAALTGFEVIFDSLAVTFAIARRRMVVPIHKKWEAGYTRIQVVRLEDRQLQLLAFFEEFQHGHCMNFLLKGTDVYENFQRGSKAGIRFVDAKFPLPRLPADKDGDYDDMAFVCLDLPDLPGEHDDISIMFESEADRDRLCQCLPAPSKGSSRITSRLR